MKTAASAVTAGDIDVRAAARREAARLGLSLGQWLDEVVTTWASTRGLRLEQIDPAQRVEAIMARLAATPPEGDVDAAAPTSQPRAGENPQGSAPSIPRDAPQGGARPMGRSEMPTAVARLRETFEDLPPVDGAGRSTAAASPSDEVPVAGVATAVEGTTARQAAQRSEIESKLNALFKALDRTPRRSDNVAVVASTEEAETVEPSSRKEALLGETAISPSWRFEKAVAEIAERQAFLESQVVAADPQVSRTEAIKTGGPRAAAHDLRRHFEAPKPATPAHGESASPSKAETHVAPVAVPSVFTSLQGDIARIAKRLDVVHHDMTLRSADAAKEPSFEQVRAMLDELRPPSTAIDALGRHVEGLSAKLDAMLDNRVSADTVDQLAQRIEDVHGELTARLSAQAVAPAPDMAQMESLIRDLVERADRPAKAMPDLQGLEAAVHELAAKLDHAERSNDDAAVLSDLQAQVGTLAARIDRSDAGLTAIAAMERSIGDIFAQLGEVRDTAIEAAERAAHTTAREMVAEARLAGGNVAESADVAHVRGELADFRANRDEADQRLHSILMALNTSLERVVDRLGALEDETGEDRAAKKASRPAMPRIDASAMQDPIELQGATRKPLDLDMPIEPGSAGRPIVARDRVEALVPAPQAAPDPTSFIAAARRAAQSAAQEQAARIDDAAETRTRAVPPASDAARGKHFKVGVLSRRRPLLLALAGLVLLMGAAQIVRLSMRGEAPQPSADVTTTMPPAVTGPKADNAVGAPVGTMGAMSAAQGAGTADLAGAKPASSLVASLNDTNPVPAPAQVTPPALPTMAMGPAASVAALKAADTSARLAAVSNDLSPALRAAADGGDAGAQFEVGLRYAEGRGVPRDMATAATWFGKAAQQGLAPAAYRLGSLYEKGLGVGRDAARAQGWYAKAADAGNVRAMHNLAVMLAEGATGKADYPTAATWFTKAAEAGVKDSQFNLAILFARGLGVEPNLGQSYKWFALAAQQGDTDSAKKRDDVAARLDPTALAAAQASVTAFKPAPTLPAANDAAPSKGGWEAMGAPAAANVPKPTAALAAHMSRL